MSQRRTNQADLAPPDWTAIRLRYEAGVMTVRAIGREYGVTHRGIMLRAGREGWVRALQPAIQAQADRILAREARESVVRVKQLRQAGADPTQRGAVSAAAAVDQSLVDHGAQMVAQVKRAHRGLIERSRSLAEAMLQELAAATNVPELFGQVHMLLDGQEDVPPALLRQMADAVVSLDGRSRTLERLITSVRGVVGMEREAYGMSAQDGTGRPQVVVHDMTGAGDPDAPPRQEDDSDE